MTFGQSDRDSFHDFTTDLLSHAESDFSLEELVMKWRAHHDFVKPVESVHRGVADTAAGRIYGLAEVDEKIRNELGLSARR